ncbi:MAG: esterase-like activity of phytase family protein [Planctomycetota bacterium]|nr:MAG: esterase-like activity of phytase family protein [Planctomycetota bacterium]
MRPFLQPYLIGLCLSLLPSTLAGQTLQVGYRGKLSLPGSGVDQYGTSFTVAGLSGLSWLAGPRFVAVMDNSDLVVELDIRLDQDGSLLSVDVVRGVRLSEWRDFEGIAFTDPVRNSVYLSEEGGPSVVEYSLDTGDRLQELVLPSVFTDPGNVVPNYGLESLTLRQDGLEMFTANEEALVVDGTLSTPSQGTVVRLAALVDTGGGLMAERQYAYLTDPMHGLSVSGARSGVSDLVLLPNGKLLVLERSFSFHLFGMFRNAIYEIDSSSATDVSQGQLAQGLLGQNYVAASKFLLWGNTFSIGQNLEGLCLGPVLASGSLSLVGVVDDGDPLSSNTVASFELFGDHGAGPRIDTVLMSGPASVVAGSSGTWTLENAPPDADFWIVSSFNQAGTFYLGQPFDVGQPITIQGQGQTDATGQATWTSAPIPITAGGLRVYLEAGVRYGGLFLDSNVLPLDIL